jgi:Zn-dependent alcohol dehydrogenase
LITDRIGLDGINEAYAKLYAGSHVRQMIAFGG